MPSSTTDAQDDVQLVEGLRAGHEEAFERLVRERGGPLLAVARRICRDEHDAADAVQEALVIAYRRISQFDGRSRLSTWLHRVTVNAALMRLRKRRGLAERRVEELLPSFTASGRRAGARRDAAWPPAPDRAAEQAEMRSRVHQAIAQLPETHRDVLILRDIRELSTGAAAQSLGIRPGAVKTRLHRARQALRELLESQGHDD